MSLIRTLDRTIWTSASSNTSSRPILSFLCPVLLTETTRRSFRRAAITRAPRIPSAAVDEMDALFIQALARAGSCSEHAKQMSTLRQTVPLNKEPPKTRRKDVSNQMRPFTDRAIRKETLGRMRRFAESELKALVDYYGIRIETEQEEEEVDDSPLIWNVGDDHEPWPVLDPVHEEHIKDLEKLLENEETPHKDIFDIYRMLPAPRVVYLRMDTIRAVLHHLAIVKHANRASMQRYLSILDDMKTAHIHIKKAEWTSAIYLAGRFAGRVTADELQSALRIWTDMETRAGVRGGVVTFNVLFDLAVKAGKYMLAEMFLKEMGARKLKVHRHFRVSLIYYQGIRQNGDAVRQAYQDLVEAGDVVDTVVMNAVIAALIRAGEPTAAEHVFERMKRLHGTRNNPKLAPKTWRERRVEGLNLTWEARRLRDDKEERRKLQEAASILPDSRTYGLLIRYHASTAGNIDRVTELLQEMQYNKVPIDGTIFIVIFHGFCSFGGVRYSSWSQDRLESVWTEYLNAVRNKVERTWLSRLAIVAALKAFRKTIGPERTLEAWREVRELWKPSEEDREHVLAALRRLVPNRGFFDENM